jgi:hypothetical protein
MLAWNLRLWDWLGACVHCYGPGGYVLKGLPRSLSCRGQPRTWVHRSNFEVQVHGADLVLGSTEKGLDPGHASL